MPSHDAYVLAGKIGSSKRTKKINIMLDKIDKRVSEVREQFDDENKKILVKSADLATKLNFSQSTVCRNGFPEFFTQYFDSITYQENRGIIIETEKYVEERKKQREEISELKSED